MLFLFKTHAFGIIPAIGLESQKNPNSKKEHLYYQYNGRIVRLLLNRFREEHSAQTTEEEKPAYERYHQIPARRSTLRIDSSQQA